VLPGEVRAQHVEESAGKCRSHHVEMGCDRFLTAIGALRLSRSGNRVDSQAELTKLKVIASCQPRATSLRLTVMAAHRLGIGKHGLRMPGGRRRNGVEPVEAGDLLDEILLDTEIEAV